MDQDFAKALFNSARERLDTAGRWSVLAILVLLFFHLVTFHPYLEARHALTTTQSLIQKLMDLKPELEKLGGDLEGFRKTADRHIKSAVNDLLQAIIMDFKVLSLRINALRSGNPELAEEASGPISSPQLMVQSQSDESSAAFRMPPLDPELAKKVREAPEDAMEIRGILRPYIENHIIQPRFEELNRRLQEQVVPELHKRIGKIRDMAKNIGPQLDELERLFQEQAPSAPMGAVGEDVTKIGGASESGSDWGTLWTDLQSALDESDQSVRSLSLKPPADKDWWISVEAKAETLADLGKAAVERLRGDEAVAVAKNLDHELDQARKKQEGLERGLQQTLMNLEKQFENQQKQIRTLGQPFQWIALDLDTVALRFPLLLALILTVLSLGYSQRMRQLALALSLLPESEALWSWYFYRTSGLGGSGSGASGYCAPLMAGLGELFGTLVWVSVAVWRTIDHALSPLLVLAVYVLPITAYLYRQWVVREARRLSRAKSD